MAKSELFSRRQPGGMFAVVNQSVTTGNVFFVHATTGTDGAGYGQNPDAPCATLDYAVGLCTASKGDIIYLMPGHAENIATSTGCVLDIAGVKVVGIGQGALRPTLSITGTTGSTISITAADVWLENILVIGNFLNIASAISIAAGGDGCTLKNIETRDTSVILGALIQISVATTVDDLTIDGYRHLSGATMTAPATNVILAAGTYNRLKILNTQILCFTTAAAIGLSAGIGLDVILKNIDLVQYETGAGLGIACHNSTKGFVQNVQVVNLRNAVVGVTGTGLASGANVNYSNALNAYAGLFTTTIDS